MKTNLRIALVACGLLGAASPLWAATATTTFAIGGTVVGLCSVSATALSFGTTIPDVVAANIDATTSINATCANTLPYTIALNAGGGTGATFAVRKMTSGANTMNYSLYTDSGHSNVWGDGTAGSVTSAGTGTGAAQTITVYGRIPPQTVTPGVYNDTITVTITY